MNERSTLPGLKTSLESEIATDATSGKSESVRTSRTAGHMKSQRAAPSERHAPSRSVVRWRAAERGAGPPMRPGSGGGGATALLLDAKTRDVGSELLILSGLVGDLVPAVGDGLLGAGLVELLRKVLRDRRVQHVLLVLLGLRDPQVQHEVLVVEAGLDRAEVVVRGLLAEAGGEPWGLIRELRRPVRVVAGLAEGHVDVRLGRCAHVRQEVVGGVLVGLRGGSVDRAGPATEGPERRVVHAVDRVRARGRITWDELATGAVEDLLPARGDRRAGLVLGLRARGQR